MVNGDVRLRPLRFEIINERLGLREARTSRSIAVTPNLGVHIGARRNRREI